MLRHTALTGQMDRIVILHQGGQICVLIGPRLSSRGGHQLFTAPDDQAMSPPLIAGPSAFSRKSHSSKRGDLVTQSELVVADVCLRPKEFRHPIFFERAVIGGDGDGRFPRIAMANLVLGALRHEE